jgi:hypothetical protein
LEAINDGKKYTARDMRRRSTNSIAVPPPPERYSSLFRDPEMIASDTTGHTAMLVASVAANPLTAGSGPSALVQVDFECAGQRPRATVDRLRASLIARQVSARQLVAVPVMLHPENNPQTRGGGAGPGQRPLPGRRRPANRDTGRAEAHKLALRSFRPQRPRWAPRPNWAVRAMCFGAWPSKSGQSASGLRSRFREEVSSARLP